MTQPLFASPRLGYTAGTTSNTTRDRWPASCQIVCSAGRPPVAQAGSSSVFQFGSQRGKLLLVTRSSPHSRRLPRRMRLLKLQAHFRAQICRCPIWASANDMPTASHLSQNGAPRRGNTQDDSLGKFPGSKHIAARYEYLRKTARLYWTTRARWKGERGAGGRCGPSGHAQARKKKHRDGCGTRQPARQGRDGAERPQRGWTRGY